jgi:hypothetical protein
MLDKFLFILRERGLETGRWLGSWKLSVVLMILAGLYYGLLAIWAASSPPAVVRNIAGLLPFWVVYALLLVNTVVCLWGRLGVLKRQISSKPFLTQGPHDWELATRADLSRQNITQLFRNLGYHPSFREGEMLWGFRRRWTALGTYLFHGAFGFLALGFLLTLASRQEARVWVAVGEEFTGQPEQHLSQSPPPMISLGPPSVGFRVDRITPEFWRDELLFTTLAADLVLPNRGRATTRINRPLWWDWCTFLRLAGFGYAPRYQIEDRSGSVLDSAFVKLNVFPPGQRDYFQIPDYPHRFYLGVMPDFIDVAGKPGTKSLNLVNPSVLLHVWRGRVDLRSATLVSGERFEFEGLKISFPEIRYWGEFSIVRDPGAPVVFLAYLLGLFGLLLKLGGKRAEITWQSDVGGRTILRGWGSPPPQGLGEEEPN